MSEQIGLLSYGTFKVSYSKNKLSEIIRIIYLSHFTPGDYEDRSKLIKKLRTFTSAKDYYFRTRILDKNKVGTLESLAIPLDKFENLRGNLPEIIRINSNLCGYEINCYRAIPENFQLVGNIEKKSIISESKIPNLEMTALLTLYFLSKMYDSEENNFEKISREIISELSKDCEESIHNNMKSILEVAQSCSSKFGITLVAGFRTADLICDVSDKTSVKNVKGAFVEYSRSNVTFLINDLKNRI